MFLIYDTETTGLPKDYNAPLSDSENWPRLVQLAWQIHDEKGELVEVKNFIVKPEGFTIPYGAEKVHGISTQRALDEGQELAFVLEEFNKALQAVTTVTGHNIEFDNSITGAEFIRKQMQTTLFEKNMVDTKNVSTDFCAIPGGKGGRFKWPTLGELHQKLFGEDFEAAHNASADVQATARCFLELIRLGVITAPMLKVDEQLLEDFRQRHIGPVQSIGMDVEPYHGEKGKEKEKPQNGEQEESIKRPESDAPSFVHLHVHTQYSVLDGLSEIKQLLEKAKKDGQTAVAITDHGAMYGVKKFHDIALELGVKPILGCEVYVARRGMNQKKTKQDGSGWHLVLLAKNREGYKNLMVLVSAGWTEGYYYKPRIDKDLLKKHSKGLIALSACLGGEIPDKTVHDGEAKAEEALLEYKEIFGEDFYLELQRHPTGDPEMDRRVFDDQEFVNKTLLALAQKHGLTVVATNDVHFVEGEDAGAHDRLICIGTAKDLDDPRRLRYTRQEWFKTRDEMRQLFEDIPEALVNTLEVADKIEVFEMNNDPIMPEFSIPEGFEDANAFLRHIAYEGARERYGEVTEDMKARIDFELETIKKMGFPDYFLIVWDFLKAAREMDVIVGPGRGSAAGSVVSYCLRITDIDPLKYKLLFERFLNPDRISMPDIDIDFDDDGREKVLKWVAEKYGKKRVAHLITFGTMAAKMAIRDVARVQKLPLSEADRLAKMVPDRPGVTLKQALDSVKEFKNEFTNGNPEVVSVIKNALTLEGSVRNTGTHACGIIISKDDLEKYVPVTTVKESVLDYATQLDGNFIESIGLLKMDFLGLKTLSIIRDTIENIKTSRGEELDIHSIPFDDKETYELYSRGETIALFQFESEGMQKYLKDLKPTRFEDLIAMNALYRPGPMDYIPSFINRKHGREKIEYDLPIMEEILKETYGITVYQEQVMLLSRLMAGFTRGQSDSLRKAMGKKKKDEMEKLKKQFLEGCKKNGLPEKTVLKVWSDWEAFANYAFNKSHATCYSHLSYQTAYLKTHYPAEFMAANLSRNLHDIKKITQYIAEANRMGISALRPDVNESRKKFTVTGEKIIRFGMAAIKGVGESAVEKIVEERIKNGPFKNIFDFAKRVNLRAVNKRSFEALAMAGAFDGFEGTHRGQYFYREDENSSTFIENVIKFGAAYQERQKSQQTSLFGDADAFEVKDPPIPDCQPLSPALKLKMEKEVTGFYISGHPLDDFRLTMSRFCNVEIERLRNDLASLKDRKLMFAGMITEAVKRTSRNGSDYGIVTVEDFTGSIGFMIFSEDYLKKKHLLEVGNNIFVIARVGKSYKSRTELDLRIIDVFLLAEAMSKLAKRIDLTVSADKVNDDLISKLGMLAKNNDGGCEFQVILKDPETGTLLQMKSGLLKVEPRSFVHDLEGMGEVEVRIL